MLWRGSGNRVAVQQGGRERERDPWTALRGGGLGSAWLDLMLRALAEGRLGRLLELVGEGDNEEGPGIGECGRIFHSEIKVQRTDLQRPRGSARTDEQCKIGSGPSPRRLWAVELSGHRLSPCAFV